MIELQNITQRFGNESILDTIDWNIETDKVLILTGPSGHGKTTLLKIIAQIISPSTGIVIHKDISNIGFLFQNNALFDSLSAYENLAFPLTERRTYTENEIDQRVKHFLGVVGLSDAENKFPAELSGGMQKRLGIARALIIYPDFMIYDEPTAGLDPITSRSIASLIQKEATGLRGGMLIVSSDLNRIKEWNGNIFFLANKKLTFVGSYNDMKNSSDPAILQFISGSPHGPLENS
ncbi:MAG: hypothetical protein A3F16_05210 [Deltaproteobacteria bacterium RIFCSPHIGHO2_12_FULL_43_9]|nr:MAG: hypothetical protein A3F16_05210 [Deltaproteobacteria bacterium RIFCSPHIGHO2_12_FULL_43_9]